MLRLSMTIPWVENSAGVNIEEGFPSDDTSLSASYTINLRLFNIVRLSEESTISKKFNIIQNCIT